MILLVPIAVPGTRTMKIEPEYVVPGVILPTLPVVPGTHNIS